MLALGRCGGIGLGLVSGLGFSDTRVDFLFFALGLVWFGLVWFGLDWFGLVWFGLFWVWFGSLGWVGLGWAGLGWVGLAGIRERGGLKPDSTIGI